MKSLISLRSFAIYICLGCVFITSCCDCDSENKSSSTTEINSGLLGNEVSAGQIWVYERNKKNPFEDIKRDTCYVIAVRDGYVQFAKNGFVRSESIGWFKAGSRRIR